MPLTNTSGNGVTAFRGIAAASQYKNNSTGTVFDITAANGQTELQRRIAFGSRRDPLLYMLGTMQVTDQHEFYIAEEERNSLARVHRATPVSRHSELRFEGSMQFERMHELFSMAAGHATTPEDETKFATGSSQPKATVTQPLTANSGWYRWIWKPRMSNVTVPEVYTWRYGDNGKFYEIVDVFAKSMDLRYEMNNAVMQSMDLFGKGLTELSIASLGVSQDEVHDAVSQLTDVYIDDVGNDVCSSAGNFSNGQDKGLAPNGELSGTASKDHTKREGLLSSATVTIPSGFEMTRYSSGTLDFSDYSQMVRSLEIEFSMRHSDAGRTELSKYRADSNRGRMVRLVTKGPTFHTLVATEAAAAGSTGTLNVLTTGIPSQRATHDDHHKDDEVKYFFVIDASILYNEPPQLFTDYNGDDVFTIRGNSYHEPNTNWDRDYAILCQTDHASIKRS